MRKNGVILSPGFMKVNTNKWPPLFMLRNKNFPLSLKRFYEFNYFLGISNPNRSRSKEINLCYINCYTAHETFFWNIQRTEDCSLFITFMWLVRRLILGINLVSWFCKVFKYLSLLYAQFAMNWIKMNLFQF